MGKRICLVASGGGHLMELMKLVPAVEEHDFYIVTEKNVASENTIKKYRHHYVLQQERRTWDFPGKFAYNILASLYFLLKERPDYIISTGAGAAYPTCKIGKMLGKKVIFLESFCRLKTPTKTAQMVYPFADHFLVQWEEMKKYFPKAEYHGTVY